MTTKVLAKLAPDATDMIRADHALQVRCRRRQAPALALVAGIALFRHVRRYA